MKLKILLYSPTFFPKTGGMETVAECLADLFIQSGHECKVVTSVLNKDADNFSFEVYRNPDLLTKIRLIRWADVVFSNGASLALFPLSKLLLKPFVWKHAGYQASCIDGLGWVNGGPAPMTPWNSIKFHFKRSGPLFAFTKGLKLLIRRFAAMYWVDMNVAITDWVAYRQPFNRQVKIYNPAPLYRFAGPAEKTVHEYDFIYVGRLVSEKGIKVLIQAFFLVIQKLNNKELKLLIIGDGPIRQELEELSLELGLNKNIVFAGRKIDQELTDLIHKASIAVIPSEWEEPMGIVAVELMAAGRNIIISEKGGLKECVGEAGLHFPNGDHIALSEAMLRLLTDRELAGKQKMIAAEQIRKFDPVKIGEQYIKLFTSIVKS